MKSLELKGQRFKKLLVISDVDRGINLKWLCKCDCGKKTLVIGRNLRHGKTKSCGCSIGKHISKSKFKHGKVGTPTYYSWGGMIARCYNPKASSFKYYGAKGIKVCKRWKNSFVNFLSDMGERKKGMSIDRINSDGNYEPKNCKWITKSENSRKAMMEKYHADY